MHTKNRPPGSNKSAYLLGIRKCNSDHNSFNEFCRGVPVIKIRKFVLKSIKTRYSNESSFFNRCASSIINAAQFKDPNNS